MGIFPKVGEILSKGGENMPRMHNYYEELLNTHYHSHLELCNELGITMDDLYTNELTDEDFE